MNLLARFNPTTSLRAEISLASGGIVLILSALLGFYASDVSKQQIEKESGLAFVQRAKNALDVLDRGMFERSREIQNAVILDEIRNPKVGVDRKREVLERLQSSFNSYAWIGICDEKGVGLVGTGKYLEGKDLSKRPWCTKGRDGVFIGDVHDALLLSKLLPNPSGEMFYLVDVAAPVIDHNGKLQGVLCGHIFWTWAAEVLDSKKTPGQDIFLLSKDGKILSGTEKPWEDFSLLASHTAKLVKSKEAADGYHLETFKDGKVYLVGYAKSEGYRDYSGLGWTAVVREDVTSAFAPARELQRDILTVGVLLGLFFAWVSWLMAGRIADPIRRISLAADKVAEGDLESEVPQIKGNGEVAHLSRAIHEMVLSLTQEIKQRRLAEAGLRLSAKVFEQNSEAIVVTDAENNIITVNRAFTEITGYVADEVVGRNPRMFSSGQQSAQFYREMWQKLNEENMWRGEIWNKRKNGDVFPEWLTISNVRDEVGNLTHHIAIFMDITERKKEEERIRQLANYDVLSGLPNRNLLADRMEQGISQALRHQTKMAVLFIDLDHFKNINDSLGHDVGDEMLKQVALNLRACLRRSDTLGRFGGDEFIGLLTDLNDESEASLVAEKMIDVLSKPFEIGQHKLHVTPSIGICICPNDGDTAMQLVRNADLAMYRAKDRGRNRFAFYEEEMNRKAIERLRLENDLRTAINQ